MKTRTTRRGRILLALGLGFALLSSACASNGPDPWEGLNRKTFAFNEGLDIYLLEPVAKGWDFVMPRFVEDRFDDFFTNLRVPLSFVNNVLMLKPREAGEDFGRFVLNVVGGFAGFFDPATGIEIPNHQAGFGLTLARWYTPPGPYFVLPVLGPSTVRDTAGAVGDFAIYTAFFAPWYITVPLRTVEAVNLRALYLEEIDENRRTSFDYYVFVRSAYLQNRARKVAIVRGEPDPAPDDDLYEFEDEE